MEENTATKNYIVDMLMYFCSYLRQEEIQYIITYIKYIFSVLVISFVYYANKNIDKLFFFPSVIDKLYYENICKEITIDGQHALATTLTKENKKAILISHGNAGSIYGREKLMLRLKTKYPHADIYCYEYNGFINSSSLGITGCLQSLKYWISYLSQKGYEQLDLYGESIGTAIIMEYMKEYYITNKHSETIHIDTIYLQSGFTSIRDLLYDKMPFLHKIYMLFMRNDLDTAENIRRCLKSGKQINIVIIHSLTDEIIPFTHAINLHNIDNKKIKIIYATGNHNNTIY